MNTVTPQQAYEALQKDVAHAALIDVRSLAEYASGHAVGAKNIPLDIVTQCMSEYGEHDALYMICRSGARSAAAGELLERVGFKGALYNVEGGTVAWSSAGLPMG